MTNSETLSDIDSAYDFPFNFSIFNLTQIESEDLFQDYPYPIADDLRDDYTCRKIDGLDFKNYQSKDDHYFLALLNVRGLSCHLNELRMYLEDSCIDILCITETHLSDSIFDNHLTVKGYKLIRHDRLLNNVRSWGGLGIYVKNEIRMNLITSSSSKIEFMIIRIENRKNDFLICLVYRPHSTNFDDFSELENALVSNIQSGTKIFICGDFNINTIHNISLMNDFKMMLYRLNLFCLPTFGTRHGNDCQSSYIDLFITNVPSEISNCLQSSFGRISDHDLLCFCILMKKEKREKIIRTFRNFKNIDLQNLFIDASNIFWSRIFDLNTVDEKINLFNSYILKLLDDHAPLVKVEICDERNQWVDRRFLRLLKKRDRLLSRKGDRNDLLRNRQLKEISKEIKMRRNLSRRKFYEKKLNTNLPSKILWNNIRELGLMKSSNSKDEIIFDPDDVNRYFLNSIGFDPSRNRKLDYSTLITVDVEDRFKFVEISELQVRKSIYAIKSNAIGDDEIPLSFIKTILPIILHVITHIFNVIIRTTTFPGCWKKGIIKPKEKVKHVKEIKDLRPICWLSGLSKAFESCLCQQINEFLTKNSLMSKFQSAYRKKHSTCTALTNIFEDLLNNFNSRNCSLMIFLDCTKAFDIVDHDDLLRILNDEFKFSKKAIMMVESYLTDRSQYVSLNDKKSSCEHVPCGVPQGSLLGPLFFSLFINDLPTVLDDSIDKGLYADDFQFIIHGDKNDLNNMIERANAELKKVSDWFSKRKLKLNASKSVGMFVCHSDIDLSDDLCDIILNDNVVKIENCVKNLGLYMDGTLSLDRHVNEMIKKIYYSLHSLKINKCYLNTDMRLKLVQALVIPHFLYCDVIVSAVNSRLRKKIEKAYKCVLRYIFGLKRRETTKDYRKSIFGCEIFKYFDYRFSLFIFKIINFREPQYLYERLSFSRSERTSNLNIPKYENMQKNKFSVRSAQIWNDLPLNVKRERDFEKFKGLSFEHFSA